MRDQGVPGRARPYHRRRCPASPAPSSWPPPSGWPSSSAGPTCASSTSAGGPTAAAPAVYAAGHIPGAVHLDWRAELVDDRPRAATRSVLASPDRIAAVAERAGIGDGTTVVLYDDTQVLYAARVWWSLRAYGFEIGAHPRRRLPGLGRGGPADQQRRGAWPRQPPARSRPRPDPAAPDDGRRPRPARRAGRALLDARAPAEYQRPRGQHPPAGPHPGRGQRAGRGDAPPGASGCATATSCAPCSAANVTRGRRLVCYDGSGVAAAKLAFVLTLLGHEDVAVYDGGWAEWGDRLDLPGRPLARRRHPAAVRSRRLDAVWRSAVASVGGAGRRPCAMPAHGSTSWCGARIWPRGVVDRDHHRGRRASPRRVRPVGRVGHRDEPP